MLLKTFPCLLIIIIQFNLIKTKASNITCDKRSQEEMDKGVSKLIVVGQKGIKFPSSASQLRPYCNLAYKTFDMVNQFNDNCLPKFGRNAARVVMHTVSTELKGVCKAGRLSKRARELLTAAPCANAGLKNFQKCNLDIIEKFTMISNAPIKQRLPLSCCNIHRLIRCLTEEAEEVKQCTRKTIDYVIKYMHKLVDPLLLILCNEYSEPSDRCDRLVELTPKRTSSQPKYNSFLIPVINIAISLGDDDPNL